MKSLAEIMRLGRRVRVVGFDDAPFDRTPGSLVNVSGIVCSGTRFEGMMWGEATKDGTDATDVLAELLLSGKFYEQVHGVLIDGLAIGGFNLIDLPQLAERLDRPCVAVMRKLPNMRKVRAVLSQFEDAPYRLDLIERAGPIHEVGGFVFQVVGEGPRAVAKALAAVTDQGQVPEPLRLAHLIGAAVRTGQSGKRA
ncbi:MAG: endonuclease V-like protein UPF0215 family [Myxococcota bacterium]|jgi:endonuclease V-like protein UPF0215 family